MEQKKRLVVLTGAGMSAESGLATFRGAGGMWNNERVEDVATPEAFYRNPRKVLDFYNYRRRELLKVEPNEGHRILVDLEKTFDVRVVTQNVDNLHERAGSTHVIHLHGELMKARSTGDEQAVFEMSKEKPEIYVGDKCSKGFQLRPHIVWFGEAVPEFENAVAEVEKADVLLIIGTSMQVYPAAGLIDYAPANCPIYLIDPNDVPVHHRVKFIQKGASEGMKEFLTLIKSV
ncbi:MAG: SIR2 family NAD-dependent protein deacylase [Paludibacteraceae bacterium]